MYLFFQNPLKIINPAIDEQTKEALDNMKDYDGIQKRTEGEVRDTVALYKKMRKRIFRK